MLPQRLPEKASALIFHCIYVLHINTVIWKRPNNSEPIFVVSVMTKYWWEIWKLWHCFQKVHCSSVCGSINVIIIIESLKVELQSRVFLSSKACSKRFQSLPTVPDLLSENSSLLLVLEYIERLTFIIFTLNSQQIRGFASLI